MKGSLNVPAIAATEKLPLPGRQFQWFLVVFHVVFLGGLGFLLVNRWASASFVWAPRETLLTALVTAQVALYTRFLILQGRWKVSTSGWVFYFIASFALAFGTREIEPLLGWTVAAYLGQLFGVAPPRVSIPSAAVVAVAFLGSMLGWERFSRLSAGAWLGYGAMALAWGALGLFIHRLVITSAERARLIAELEAARKELEHARQMDAELAALRERERLARDLHDGLGHSLVTLTVQLEAAQRLYAVDPARGSAVLDEMKNLTRASTEALRRSLAGLRAPGLGERPLDEALEGLCEQVGKRAGVAIRYDLAHNLGTLSPSVAEVVWRVCQEGLANIEKHARARSTNLVVAWTEGAEPAAPNPIRKELLVRVSDDGTGLPADAENKPGHFGLRGLRERVEGMGGRLTVAPGDAGGTLLEVHIPVVV